MNASDQPSRDAVPWSTGQRRPRALLLGSGDRPDLQLRAKEVRKELEKHLEIVLADFTFQADLSAVEADLAVVVGGDGSILRAAKQMRLRQLPVLGINLGKLGFLANLSPHELTTLLPQVCCGQCCIVEHLMFQCSIVRGEQVLHEELGLNEVAVLSGPPFSMLNVDLYVDSILATTYSCDGLIISTPVGSTAHSLSAGGPILRKSLQAFVISPISPHTLTVRPVVDTADRLYEVRVQDPDAVTSVVVDGRLLCSLTAQDRVCVERAQPKFKMVEVPGHNYYRTLREKLGWSGNIRSHQR